MNLIVDESGVLKELRRMDGAPLISVQTAVSKAYAAAAIGMPPDEFYAAIESDGAAVASFATRPGLALIGGGMPVVTDGQVAGALGVAVPLRATRPRHLARGRARARPRLAVQPLRQPCHRDRDIPRRHTARRAHTQGAQRQRRRRAVTPGQRPGTESATVKEM